MSDALTTSKHVMPMHYFAGLAMQTLLAHSLPLDEPLSDEDLSARAWEIARRMKYGMEDYEDMENRLDDMDAREAAQKGAEDLI